jgi:hypothetical protein
VRLPPAIPPPPKPPPPERDPLRGVVQDYRPLSPGRRRLVGLLGVCTALFILYAMIARPGREPPPWLDFLVSPEAAARAAQAEAAANPPPPVPCAPGQTQGCVGGRTDLIRVVPVR